MHLALGILKTLEPEYYITAINVLNRLHSKAKVIFMLFTVY